MLLSDEEYEKLSPYLEEISGIKIGKEESYLFEYRLTSLAKELGCDSFNALYHLAKEDASGALGRRMTAAMSTHETSFFRDRLPFDFLKKQLLPHLVETIGFENNALKRPLRIWSAGCSSGQEAYSIAMTVKEALPKGSLQSVEIFASDLSEKMIQQASKGLFGPFDLARGLQEKQIQTYFNKSGQEWRIKDELRELITFKQLNLLADWGPLPLFDIIFCRHVLIYFAEEVKQQILERFAQHLYPQGTLILGSSEKADAYCDQFVSTYDHHVLSYRKS